MTESISRIDLETLPETTEPEFDLKKKLINTQDCGKTVQDRIVGGEIAGVNSFPWLALLQYRSKDDENFVSFRCGGSLINERYVLTGN